MSEARARLNELPKKYPLLFKDGYLEWGFSIGDGWSEIVVALCDRLNTLLSGSPGARMEVLQVKEKFGGLRFYYSFQGDEVLANEIGKAVELAEAACVHTCELCGKRASLGNQNGWYSTLCPACRGKRRDG